MLSRYQVVWVSFKQPHQIQLFPILLQPHAPLGVEFGEVFPAFDFLDTVFPVEFVQLPLLETAALFDLTAGTHGPEASLIKPGFEIARSAAGCRR